MEVTEKYSQQLPFFLFGKSGMIKDNRVMISLEEKLC